MLIKYSYTCLKLVKKGRRPDTCIDRAGYEIMVSEFSKRTGMEYDRHQLKNHWDKTKDKLVRWNKLRANTGLGWDSTKNTVIADEGWWDECLKKYPNDKDWQYEGLEYAEELNIIYGGTHVTGGLGWAPSQGSIPNDGLNTTLRVETSSSMNIEDDNDRDDHQAAQTPLEVDIEEFDEIDLTRVEREEMRDKRRISGSRRRSVGGHEPTPQR